MALPASESIAEITSEEEINVILKQIDAAMTAFEALSEEEAKQFSEEHSDLLMAVTSLNEAITGTRPVILNENEIEVNNAEGFQSAISSANDGDTLKLTQDIDLGNTSIVINKPLIINLNGHTISQSRGNAITFSADSTLTITDTATGGKITSTGASGQAVYNGGSGTILIEGGILEATGDSSRVIYNSSTGTIIINGGIVSSNAQYEGIAVYNYDDGEIEVNGGTVENLSTMGPTAIYNYANGTVTVTGGKVESKGNPTSAIYNHSNGSIKVSGGEVITTDGISSYTITNYSSGSVEISGGIISALKGTAILNSTDGNIKISSGTVSVSAGYAIYNRSLGTVNISGGTVSANIKHTIYNVSTGKITISDVAKVTNASNGSSAIYLNAVPSPAAIILEVNGGTVENTSVPQGYSVYFNTNGTGVTYDNLNNYYNKTSGTVGKVFPAQQIAGAVDVISSEGLIKDSYASLADAIENANSGDTLKINSNIDLGSTGVTISGKTLTIDLNGQTVASSGGISAIQLENNANLTMTDNTTNKTGMLMTTSSGTASIYNTSNGSVVINGGTVLTTASGYGIINVSGTIVVNGGTVWAKTSGGYAIFDLSSNDIEINGGTINGNLQPSISPAIVSVSVLPETVRLKAGKTQQFNAIVSSINISDLSVTWSVSGSTNPGTTINNTGLLTIAEDETASTLTVKATSNADSSKSGTANVTIPPDTTALDTAITAAIQAKNNVTVSNQPASSVSSGTKFVTTAEMKALTDAISEAEDAIDTVTTLSEVQDAIDALNTAVDTFKAAIKTGTYTASSGGSRPSSKPSTDETPSTITEGEIKVEGNVDESGNTIVTLPEQIIKDAVKQAEAEAKENGDPKSGISLVIHVDTNNLTGSGVTVNLPKVTQETIINKKIVNTVLVLDNPDIQIDMNLVAIKEIYRQAKADVNITVVKQDNNKLTASIKHLIGERPVFSLTASYGSKRVSDFGTGLVSVTIPYTSQAGEKASDVFAVYIDEVGNAAVIANSVYDAENKLLRFTTNHFSLYGVGYNAAANFSDILNHWAKDDIQFMVNRGLLAGTNDVSFSPDAAVSRGTLAAILGRMANADISGYTKSSFTDIKKDAYYMGYVEWVNTKDIMNGKTSAAFAPDSAITREEMALILFNYTKAMKMNLPAIYAENIFADASKISAESADAVKQLQMAGILAGKSDNRFDPQGIVTKAEVSAIIHRFIKLTMNGTLDQGWTQNDAGQWMYFENGTAVKNQIKNIDGKDYKFDIFGIATDISASKPQADTSEKNKETYTVKSGDCFWSIARMYNVDMYTLAVSNGKTLSAIIYPGEILIIPQQ
ncbi:S-layer homology domain-containing protein [Dielma fastidiosa]|uniref:S-layer homology domain-containing protein n=1 Tax=Dielma fastidiosa TaxID=1034346 RepID=A0AB35UW83_9FIRM|nr:S-layer homology domain-containing protein [Dielma fastidiosa]MDY5169584.1 S-layer homology domain-containing protein [Dielma fastidiosa]